MKRLGVALLFVSAWWAPASAHQLDEYLQAAQLEISRDRVVLYLNLTPGMSIAPQIVAMIDRDGDRVVSAREVEAYARQVMPDVSLWIDGLDCPLTLTRAQSPEWSEMRDGTGTIRIEAVGEAPLRHGGTHHIAFQNVHQPSISVYVVNALKPSSHHIAIGGQRRDLQQHRIDLDVEVAGLGEQALWVALAAALFGGVLTQRLRHRTAAQHIPPN
jgi:hypothetical protein